MKRLALALWAFAVLPPTSVLYAQGTVSLNNYDSGRGLYVQLDEGGPILPAPAGTSVMIFGGATLNSLAPVTNSAGQSVFTVSSAGVEARGPGSGSYFEGGIGVVPGTPSNGTGLFAIRAWAYAPSFSDAVACGAWLVTGVWQQAVGGASAPVSLNVPERLILMPSIPEPSAMALAALGLAGWLVFCRRKSRQGAWV